MDSTIGPQSSADDIENEKILVHVMITSLDVHDENYNQDKEALESKLRYYEQLLRIKSNSATPTSARNPSLPTSATLPSRSRPSIPNWAPREPSPSDRKTIEGTLDPRALSLDGYTSESSNGAKKRPRQDSNLTGMPSSSKFPRTHHTERPATSSTSNSWGSPDEELLAFGGQSKVRSNGTFESYMRRAQREEERWRREQADQELARQLSEQAQAHAPPSSSFPTNGALNQSYIAADGTYARPIPPAVPIKQEIPAYFGTTLAGDANYQHNLGSSNTNFQPNSFSAPAYVQPLDGQWGQVDEDDDDLQIITPEQFGARTSAAAHGRSRYQPRGPVNYGSIPGSFPHASYADLNFSGQEYQSNPGQSFIHSSSNYMGASALSLGQQMSAPVSNGWSAAQGIDPSVVSSSYHGQAGSSVFGDPTVNNYSSTFDDEGGLSREVLQDLESRQMGYMLADPTKTKEDIVQLLENIRPDEELPPELREGGPKDLRVQLMEHQKLGLAWMKQKEESSNKGSILADDMGLGKTIQALALILDRPSPNPTIKTTLIVAPLALLRQWRKEIMSKVTSKRPLRVHLHHGQGQKWKYARLAQCDVVLTTYGTLAMEWKRRLQYLNAVERAVGSGTEVSKPELNLIAGIDEPHPWYRVILDEGQAIKNRGALCSLGAGALETEYRLIMTGTPMMNNVQELYSLIRFLRISPYHQLNEFQKTFRPLFKAESTNYAKDKAMERLQLLLKAILLRRMKTSKIDDKPILNLKDRIVEEKHAVFDDEQKAFYESLEKRNRLQFNKYLKAGTIGKNYSNILVLLLRLRQACDHPNLISNHGISVEGEVSASNMEEFAEKLSESAIIRIKEANGAFECPICYDASENPTIFFPCGHDVCSECFARMMDPSIAVRNGEESSHAKCPECRQPVDPVKILTYNLFKKVHMPVTYKQEFPDDVDGSVPSSPSDTDSSSDDDSDDEIDSRGNLRNFVVADSEVVSGNESEDSGIKLEPGRDDDNCKSLGTCAKLTGKWKPEKIKQKRRKKGKEREKTLAQLKKEGMRNAAAKKKYLKRLRKHFVSSAKLEKTMELLKQIREDDPTEKTIVFSQFTAFLDLLEVPISDSKWKWARYDGSMSAKDRNIAVDSLVDDPACNIMLISLKAGNAGLNLNCASQVIILDPFWNPFIEEQAIDRAHRIGQLRDVYVHRILIEGTVEDRIVALQEKKRLMINTALDEDKAKNLSRLGPEELIYLFGSGNAND